MNKIDFGTSSYQYLKAFDRWLKISIAEYVKIYRYFYPLLFLFFIVIGMFSSLVETESGDTPIHNIMNDPDTYLLYGAPVFWILPLLLILGLISYFSEALFKLDLNSIYGGVFKKLKELLVDMEELRTDYSDNK